MKCPEYTIKTKQLQINKKKNIYEVNNIIIKVIGIYTSTYFILSVLKVVAGMFVARG